MDQTVAFLIGHMTIKDEEKWAEYRSKVPATLSDWGAAVIFRGKCSQVLSGRHDHTDTVIIRFPDQDKITGWYHSPAYQALIPLRKQAAEMVLIGCES
jgi:uncharacterized protein (DUF1330 family)